MKSALLVIGAACTILVAACDKDDSESLNQKDKDFMDRATYINIGEVSAGDLARQKATNGGIKQYGEMMIADHTNAQDQLDGVAAAVNYALPQDTDQEHKDMAQMLQALSGDAFDSTYIYKMVEGHDKAIALFEDEAASGGHKTVRQYAATHVTALRHHRMAADSLAKALFP